MKAVRFGLMALMAWLFAGAAFAQAPGEQHVRISLVAESDRPAPGSEVTRIPCSRHMAAITSPGSEMAGVPASVTTAMLAPRRSLLISSSAFVYLLYS